MSELARQTGLLDARGRPVRGLPPQIVSAGVAEATAAWETEQAPAQLTRYAQHALLPKEIGAHASSIQAWDYHLGLILRALDAAGIPHHITTIGQ